MLVFESRVLKLLLFFTVLSVIFSLSTVEQDTDHLQSTNEIKYSESRRQITSDVDDSRSPEEIDRTDFVGNWKSDGAVFMGLTSDSGRSYLDSKYDVETRKGKVLMTFFDGDWEDDDVRLVVINDGVFDTRTRRLYFNSTVQLYDSSSSNASNTILANCKVYGDIGFADSEETYMADGYLTSESCGTLVMNYTKYTEDMQKSSRVTYCGIFTVLNIVIFLSIAKHTQDCIESEQYAKRTSLLTLVMNASIDMALCLWHMKLATSYFLTFDFMVLAALWSFSLYMMIQHRLTQLVWKAQNEEVSAQGWRVVRRLYSAFSTRFVIVVAVTVSLGYLLQQLTLGLIVVLHCSWVPQIVRNAIEGYKVSWKPQVYMQLTIARYCLLFYIFGCPANFLIWRPRYWLVILLLVLMVLQLSMLSLQSTLGPRFFVPVRFRPQVYSYYRNLEEDKIDESTECMICLSSLLKLPEPNVKIMRTPCNHKFHEECLKRWMEVKMQCPTCRSELPIIEE